MFPDFTTWFALLPPMCCFYKMAFSYFQSLISCLQGHLSIIVGGDKDTSLEPRLFYLSNGCGLGRLAEFMHLSTGIATAPFPNGNWPSDTALGCEMEENNMTSFRI